MVDRAPASFYIALDLECAPHRFVVIVRFHIPTSLTSLHAAANLHALVVIHGRGSHRSVVARPLGTCACLDIATNLHALIVVASTIPACLYVASYLHALVV